MMLVSAGAVESVDVANGRVGKSSGSRVGSKDAIAVKYGLRQYNCITVYR